MVNEKKPYLGSIKEFGLAAYVKDIKVGKLYPRAQNGCYVGYDSEGKNFRIYRPEKSTISIERNAMFNPDDQLTGDDSVVIQDDVLNEEERGKVIQNSPKDEDNKKR
jgi:hypothetical protein